MAGSSRNSDRRNDNSYPPERKPRERTMRERASEAFDTISRALNPRTYLEEPAGEVRDTARNTLTIGAERRRRQIEAATGEGEGSSGGRRGAPEASRRSRR